MMMLASFLFSARRYFMLLVPFLFFGCNKAKFEDDYICLENCVVFSGRIADTPFNHSLSGVQVKFYYHPSGSSFLRPPVYLGTKTTGEDGIYTFKFDGKEYIGQGFFSIEGKKEGYFADPTGAEDFQTFGSIQSKEIQYDTPILTNINLYKRAILELKVQTKNKPDFDNLDVYYGTTKRERGGFDYKNGYFTGFNILFDDKIDTIININIPTGIKSFVTWQGYDYLAPYKINETDSVISQNGEKVFYEIVL